MKLSFLFFGNKPDTSWSLVKQMGVTRAIAKLAPEITGHLPPWDIDSLNNSKKIFRDHGLELIGLEGDQFDMNRIKFGLEGADEDIARYKKMLMNMGELGIHLLCYNFMAGIGWYRTRFDVEERGGAMVSAFDLREAKQLPYTSFGQISAQQIWKNYCGFVNEVIPVAEKAGVKMALHPDDPPIESLRGIGRIFTSASAIREALTLSDSPSHGITFCLGTYSTMGENVISLIEEFGSRNRIHFMHIRDVIGNRESFRETFHDNGSTDLVAVFNALKSVGFAGPLRSDHVPTMAGEKNVQHGYGMLGNLFGIGYLKGIIDAVGIKLK